MNNYETMREVLEGLNSLFESGAICTSYMNTAEETWQIEELYRKAQAALAAPPRQCDIGTAEELGMRYNSFCRKHFTPDQLGGNCRKCPLKDRRGWSCQLAWAQMPYAEEGGAQ